MRGANPNMENNMRIYFELLTVYTPHGLRWQVVRIDPKSGSRTFLTECRSRESGARTLTRYRNRWNQGEGWGR